MAGVDTSIYSTVSPQGMNLQQTVSTANALLQNRQAQEQFLSNKVLSSAAKLATDPVTGVTDWRKYAAIVAASPAGYNLLPATAQIQGAQKGQLEIEKGTLELGAVRQKAISDAVAPLLANPNVTPVDVMKAGINAVVASGGAITADQVAKFVANLPKDPAQIRQALTQLYIGTRAGGEQTGLIFGTPGTQQGRDQHGRPVQENITTSPIMGVRPAPTAAPGGNALMPPVAGGMMPSPTGQNALGAVPGANVAPGVGMPPPAPTGAPAGPLAPQGGILRTPTGGIVTGLAPGEEDAAKAGVKQAVTLQEAADAVPTRKAVLANMLDDLKQFKSGPTADREKWANALSQRLAGFGITMTAKQIAAQENFEKLGNQIALAQAGSLGATDQRVQTAMGANPGTNFSNLGNEYIMNVLKGNEDAIAAKNAAWQEHLASGQPANTYGKWSTDFNKRFDPRVFQFVYMTPEQRTVLLKGMNDKDKAEFAKRGNEALKNGWIGAPS